MNKNEDIKDAIRLYKEQEIWMQGTHLLMVSDSTFFNPILYWLDSTLEQCDFTDSRYLAFEASRMGPNFTLKKQWWQGDFGVTLRTNLAAGCEESIYKIRVIAQTGGAMTNQFWPFLIRRLKMRPERIVEPEMIMTSPPAAGGERSDVIILI